jgi:uncharacterized protein (DUF2267 family)
MLSRMDGGYRVRGGVGPPLPGIVGPAELDGRSDWVEVERERDLLGAVSARLGSEVDLHKVVLGVLAPLCPALDGAPLGALVAQLPLSLGRELVQRDVATGARLRAPRGAADYLLEVARLIQHPPARAVTYVRAVFAAARKALPREHADEIARRLPPDLAELWRTAR